ncbi:hypothetical protein OQX64_03740 [Pedobacter sp. GR22-10]|nr:hypothetical protein [Pedobacter sp. GR22-10]
MVNRKYREFNESLFSGLTFHNDERHKHALGDFRDAIEAFMKILILGHFGDDVGHGIITGFLDHDGINEGKGDSLSYFNMLTICNENSLANSAIREALTRLQRTHPGAHNPNAPTDYSAISASCLADMRVLSKFLSDRLSQPEPSDILLAFEGDSVGGNGSAISEDPWAKVCELTDNFDRTNRYVLISPPRFEGVDNSYLLPLSRIDWSFVLDFDPFTKKDGGLHTHVENQGARSIVNITIQNRGQRNLVGNGGLGSTNWLFANGIESMPDTICRNLEAWRSKNYHRFIQEMMREFFARETRPYVFIYLWDNLDYINELVKIWDNVELAQDRGKHLFITSNLNSADKFRTYVGLGFDVTVIPITTSAFIGKLQEFLVFPDLDDQRYLVPGRTKIQENDTVDVTDIYYRLADDGVNIVHQSIYREKPLDDVSQVPSFLKGEDINWNELALDTDVKRHRYQDLFNSIRNLLGTTKRSRRFELIHKPGGGGTILGHRLAFDLRGQFPVVLISQRSARTFQALSTLLDRVNQTVLAIVEASVFDIGSLDELIRELNARRLNIVFLHIRRSLQVDKSRDFTFFLNDSMADRIEMEQFMHLVKMYGSEDTARKMSELNRQPSTFEVIDFTLSINENEFNSQRLNQYVGEYINMMSDSHVAFTVYVCFVYYYSQKSVSHYVFRSLFKKSLIWELKEIPLAKRYIHKILVQQFDYQSQELGEYWRPRFAKFAEVVLSHVLGHGTGENWKDHIASYAKKFIEDFRLNNEFLVAETRDILKAVFFDRDDELPENGEQTPNLSVERFSRLMSDIGTKERQLEVLQSLIKAYPNESHFHGQLGRFIFEKAEEFQEFREAEKLISEALDTKEGENDYNLHHIAGMCKSREIRFLLRNYRRLGTSLVTESRLKELVEIGSQHFADSVHINNYNVHGYVAHFQMLMEAIDYGREMSGMEDRWNFLNAPDKRWYMEKFVDIQRLMETTKSLMENEETLGLSNRVLKTRKHIKIGEARTFDLMGEFNASLDVYKSIIDTVEREHRPHSRIMAIYAILMGKVKGNRKRVDLAWGMLKSDEVLAIRKMLDENILQDPSHVLSFKLWFKLVRFSNIEIGQEELIANLRSWFENAGQSRILRAEAAFYLFILYAVELIDAGDSFSPVARTQCEFYIEQSVNNSYNKKFIFEHLGYGDGFKALINHRSVRDTEEEEYQRLEGTIAKISARQEGKIALKCGLDAFFVPKEGSFVQMKDETVDVTFRVGFRPEGLVAFDVRRVSKNEEITTNNISELNEVEAAEEVIEPIDPKLETDIEEDPAREIHGNYVKLQGPKIVTKIILDDRNTKRKKK